MISCRESSWGRGTVGVLVSFPRDPGPVGIWVHKEGNGFSCELERGLEKLKMSDMFQSATDGGRDGIHNGSDISTAGGLG